MAEKLGRISLNDRWYKIDLESYRARDVSDYAPRASTPGGGIVYSEMSLYQPLAQDDWRHGFGFLWHTDSAGFYDTEGDVDTRFPGVVMPFTKAQLSSTIPYARYGGFTLLNDRVKMLAWGNHTVIGIYTYATNTWVDGPRLPSTVKGVWSNGTYDFILLNDSRLLRAANWASTATFTASGGGANYIDDSDATFVDDQYNGKLVEIVSGTGAGQSRIVLDTVAGTKRITVTTNWTTNPDATSTYRFWDIYETGINANSADYSWMTAHDGYVFAGKDGTNQVYYGSAETLSDLHGSLVDDPNAILVGVTGRAVKGAISFSGDLFFARDDALYRMDKDRTAARKVLDYADQASPLNFASMAVYNGALIFPIRSQLYQWNGVRVNPITPPRIGVTHPYSTYTNFDNLTVVGNFLFMTARRQQMGSNHYQTDLLCFDGVGWHRLSQQMSAGSYSDSSNTIDVTAMQVVISSSSDDIWFQTTQTAGSGATTGMYRIRLGREGDYPYPYYDTVGSTGSLITSRFDAGFRRVTKSTPSILIEGSNLSSTTYLLVYYRTDAAPDVWMPWGGEDGVTNKLTDDGLNTLIDPTGTFSDTLEYKWIQLKINLIATASSAPILESTVLRVLLRPETMYGYSFSIVAASDVEYAGAGATSGGTPASIIREIRIARDSQAPIKFITPFGSEVQVYVTSLTEVAITDHVADMGAFPDIEHSIQVNLIDVDTYGVRIARNLPELF